MQKRSLVGLVLLAILALAFGSTTGLADPLFGPMSDFGTGSLPCSVVIGDLNGDGKPDLVVANRSSNTVSVLLGNGDGVFGAKTDFGTGSWPLSVAIGDLNGDGEPDLAVATDSSNTVSVLLGNGNGTFGAKNEYGVGDRPWSVAIGDLNGDGKPDLTVANAGYGYGYYPGTVSVLLGNGDGTFGAKTDYGAGGEPRSVAIGDLNGDGKPDLAVANNSSGTETPFSTASVLLGNGNGTFGAKTDYEVGLGSTSVAIGDLNGDGKPDLAVSNAGYAYPGHTVSVLLGNGDGTFGERNDYGVGDRPRSVAIGDLDGDGRPDLAVVNAPAGYPYGPGTVGVLLGNGNGTFGAMTNYGYWSSPTSPTSLAIGDLNGDGMPDLAVTVLGSNVVSVLLYTPGLPTPTLVELFRAVPTVEGIRVEWQLSDQNAFQSIELQRSMSETGPWSRLQQTPQVQGEVTWVLDDEAAAGQIRWYRLSGVQRDGYSYTYGPISALAQEAITAFTLSPLSPNPSTGRSLVTFAVPARTWVRLTLADVQGREVVVLADGIRQAGRYAAVLDARDLPPGTYFVRMQAKGVNLTRRLAVVK